MSDKASEYLKRTCLICGCHTNQTINIYEPRSGPNIVQLIQAKFKFQPLNEDKYLCFSCNNWLINWHSLQAMNSNDADSPSGTFRPHMNSMLHEEGGEKPSKQRKQQHTQQNVTQQKVAAPCRPIAQVRPWQLDTRATDADGTVTTSEQHSVTADAQTPMTTPSRETCVATVDFADTKPVDIIISRRQRSSSHRSSPIRKSNSHLMQIRWRPSGNQTRDSRTCCMCGKRTVMQLHQRNRVVARRLQTAKCRKCHIICNYLRSVEPRKRRRTAHKTQPKIAQKQYYQHDPVAIEGSSGEFNQVNAKCDQSETRRHCLQRPLIDGKVVAMLRRLGTTLSREDTCENGSSVAIVATTDATAAIQKPLPLIMSPAKPKPRWTRRLDEDEILLDFDAAISEVLPLLVSQNKQNDGEPQKRTQRESELKQVKRKLTYSYQMTNGKENRQSAYPVLPAGLSISLV